MLVTKKQCRQDTGGPGQEITRTARSKNGSRGTTAKGRAHIGALTVLNQHQANKPQGQKEMYYGQYGLHFRITG
jgi:hypothetical protein